MTNRKPLKYKRKSIFKWIKEHVSVKTGWDKGGRDDDELSWKNTSDIKHNIKKRATVGIKFRWKF